MSNKYDANVRKSTLVNFQIGLIASLLFTYVMFEVYTAKPVLDDPEETVVFEPENVWHGVFEEYKEPELKPIAEKRTKPVVDPQEFEVIKDDQKIKEAQDEFKSEPQPDHTTPIDPGEIEDIKDDEDPVDYSFTAVEFVPVFPGCENLGSNEERAKCFSDKIKRIVSKKFNTDLGADLGLNGLQRIYVQFDVYKDGTIQNIKARATHPLLEKEAIRVVKKFPVMTPGRQRDKNVTVKYQLPIAFKVQN